METNNPWVGRVKILLVEDQLIQLDLFRNMFYNEKTFYAIDGCTNAYDGLKSFVNHRGNIDIVLTDLKMPEKDGLQLIREIRDIDKDVKLVMLTCYDGDEHTQQLVREAGGNGYISKFSSSLEVIEKLKLVWAGEEVWDVRLPRSFVDFSVKVRLTPGQYNIIKLIKEGYNYNEIARKLGNVVQTCRNQVHLALQANGCSNANELIQLCEDQKIYI